MKELVKISVIHVAVAVAAACAREQPAASSGAVAMSPERVVAGRQAAFRLSQSNFMVMRLASEKGAETKALASPARSLAHWAKALPGMFPPGTGPGVANTRARAEIWSNRADFERKAADYAAAAARMADAAEAGNLAEGRVQWDATWRSCGACHDLYRSELPAAR